MSDEPKKKTTAEVLREALAAKQAAAAAGRGSKPRPDKGSAKAAPDAERLAGKSRKVH